MLTLVTAHVMHTNYNVIWSAHINYNLYKVDMVWKPFHIPIHACHCDSQLRIFYNIKEKESFSLSIDWLHVNTVPYLTFDFVTRLFKNGSWMVHVACMDAALLFAVDAPVWLRDFQTPVMLLVTLCKSRLMSLFDREEWQRFWWCQATDEGALLPDRRGGCPCHGAGPAAAAGRFPLWETACI